MAEPLHHHHAVLHQDPDPHAEPGQGEQVGGDPEEVEAERGAGDRDGGAPHHQRGGADVAKRQQEDEADRREADRAAEHQVAELLGEPYALVGFEPGRDAGRQDPLDAGHRLLHPARGLDHVGAGEPGDLEPDRRHPVEPREAPLVVLLRPHRRELGERVDPPVPGADREPLEVLVGVGLVAEHHRAHRGALVLLAQRLHHPGAGDRGGEQRRRDVELAEPLHVVGDRDAVLRGAEGGDVGDAGHGGEPRFELLVGQPGEGARRVGAGEGILEQRLLVQLLGHVVAHLRGAHPDREFVPQELEPLVDGEPGELDVHGGLELDGDAAPPLARLAAGLPDPAHPLDRRLHRRGDVGLQQLGGGAGPGGVDREAGELDAGLGGERELGERDPPREHQRDAESPDDGRAGGGPSNHAWGSLRLSIHAYAVGNKKNVTKSAVTLPPITPAASGL